jgi:TonB family protein
MPPALLVALLAAGDAGVVASEAGVVLPTLVEESPARKLVDVPRTVVLELILDERGEVAEARVTTSAGLELDRAALEASTRLRFTPARVDGRAVPSQLEFRYEFLPAPTAQPRSPLASSTGTQPLPIAGVPAEPSGPSYETVVKAERDSSAGIPLKGAEAQEVAGTQGDPLRAVMLMPGVSSVLSGLAYPVVRGTDPSATGYFIDGIRVPLLFHLGLGPSVVHPELVDSVEFYPGAPPAQYGRLIGGAIVGNLAPPRTDGPHASAYVDLVSAGAFAEVPIPATGTDVSIAARTSYSHWLTSLVSTTLEGPGDPRLSLDFGDYQARVEQSWKGWDIRLLGLGSSDSFGAVSTDPMTADTSGEVEHVVFHRLDARVRHPLGPGELELGATAGFDEVSVDEMGTGSFQMSEPKAEARAIWRGQLGPSARLELGGDVDHRTASMSTNSMDGSVASSASAGVATLAGGWAQLSWTPVPGFRLEPGLRVDDYHLVPGIDFVAVEPRVAVRKSLGEGLSLKGGAGIFHQAPSMLIDLPVVDITGLRSGLQEAVQLDTGLEWRPQSTLEVTVDAYVDPLTRTVEIDPFETSHAFIRGFDALFSPSYAPPVPSHGLAYGLDVMVRRPLQGNWFGWLSASLERSTRFTSFVQYDAYGRAVGLGSGELPFTFDQTLVLNAALSYHLPRNWTVGAVAHFNTGRPENGDLTSSTEAPVPGGAAWANVSLDRVNRLPPFFRLDLRAEKSWTTGPVRFAAYLDVLNATASNEVVSYVYSSDPATGALTKSANTIPLLVPSLGVRATY